MWMLTHIMGAVVLEETCTLKKWRHPFIIRIRIDYPSRLAYRPIVSCKKGLVIITIGGLYLWIYKMQLR